MICLSGLENGQISGYSVIRAIPGLIINDGPFLGECAGSRRDFPQVVLWTYPALFCELSALCFVDCPHLFCELSPFILWTFPAYFVNFPCIICGLSSLI